MKKAVQIELPSVEHPKLLTTVVEQSNARGVQIDRVSFGGGLPLLTHAELVEYLDIAHSNGIEVFAYMSARGSYEPSRGPDLHDQLQGEAAFGRAVADIDRCIEFGMDGVLVADVGLLAAIGRRRLAGALGGLQLKTAIAIAPANASAIRLYEELGATSINVASTQPLGDLIAMRESLREDTTIDIYVESPASHGGGLRYFEAPALADNLSPIVFKLGLSNAPSLNPYGAHLEAVAQQTIVEKVRRAELLSHELGTRLEGHHE